MYWGLIAVPFNECGVSPSLHIATWDRIRSEARQGIAEFSRMAHPSIAGWNRKRPKGHAKDRLRRKPATRRISAPYGCPPIRTFPGANPARSLRTNVFPAHSSSGKQRQARRERNGSNNVRPKGDVQERTLPPDSRRLAPRACLGAPEASGYPGKDTQDLWAQPHKGFTKVTRPWGETRASNSLAAEGSFLFERTVEMKTL